MAFDALEVFVDELEVNLDLRFVLSPKPILFFQGNLLFYGLKFSKSVANVHGVVGDPFMEWVQV